MQMYVYRETQDETKRKEKKRLVCSTAHDRLPAFERRTVGQRFVIAFGTFIILRRLLVCISGNLFASPFRVAPRRWSLQTPFHHGSYRRLQCATGHMRAARNSIAFTNNSPRFPENPELGPQADDSRGYPIHHRWTPLLA